jgi:2-dehydro-3-deoxyphosphogalactonate aldolase
LVGAGTVLKVHQVSDVRAAGGRIIVSPSTNRDVIAATASEGLVSSPGYFTPSEAFEAIEAGATALKLFPAEGASPAVLKAQLAVLPKHVPIIVVGGVKPDNMQPWLDAGATGFGLGGGLYQPGQSAEETAAKARAYVAGVGR